MDNLMPTNSERSESGTMPVSGDSLRCSRGRS